METKNTTLALQPLYPPLTQTRVKDLYSLSPPLAEKIPHQVKVHGEERVDDYAWLRDKNWPKVNEPKILNYLKAENAYTDGIFSHFQTDLDALYREMIGRIKLTDSSVPIKKGDYYYYSRTEADSEHLIYCRKKGSLQAAEEIILNANELAKNSKYYSLGTLLISEDQRQLLYSEDVTGEDRYTVQVKDLTAGKNLNDKVKNTIGNVIWNKDGTGFFYSKLNNQWRHKQAYFHKLGDDQSNDKLLYEELDPLFTVSVSRSNSKRFLFINSSSANTNEIRYIDLSDPQKMQPVLIQARINDRLYDVEHHGDLFYIQTNDKGKNFRLVTAPIATPQQTHWQEMIPYNKDIYLSDFSLYKNHLVLTLREAGLNRFKIINLTTKEADELKFPEASYEASDQFTTYDDNALRISYSSLSTPDTIYAYDFENKKLTSLKTLEIPSGYDKDLYQVERVFAVAKDGTKVPISLVYKKSLFKKDGKNPLYLYGYGAYGYPSSADFRPSVLSLLDRGFVYAIAHVRGGDEMGYEWYEDAKFLKKKNTFTDFIASAQFLVKEKYTSAGNISITGRSAGGMFVGVSVNEHPELFKVALADVPFVDVLNTMLDDTLPLTPGEFEEWGNPKDFEYYRYIKSYSPYDKVKPQKYPAMYVYGSINDPRVTYWEPAKWVAKLRELKTDDNLLLLYTNMEAGHAGASGRFSKIKELSKEYLFILLQYGIGV